MIITVLVDHESCQHSPARCAFFGRYFTEKVAEPNIMMIEVNRPYLLDKIRIGNHPAIPGAFGKYLFSLRLGGLPLNRIKSESIWLTHFRIPSLALGGILS